MHMALSLHALCVCPVTVVRAVGLASPGNLLLFLSPGHTAAAASTPCGQGLCSLRCCPRSCPRRACVRVGRPRVPASRGRVRSGNTPAASVTASFFFNFQCYLPDNWCSRINFCCFSNHPSIAGREVFLKCKFYLAMLLLRVSFWFLNP